MRRSQTAAKLINCARDRLLIRPRHTHISPHRMLCAPAASTAATHCHAAAAINASPKIVFTDKRTPLGLNPSTPLSLSSRSGTALTSPAIRRTIPRCVSDMTPANRPVYHATPSRANRIASARHIRLGYKSARSSSSAVIRAAGACPACAGANKSRPRHRLGDCFLLKQMARLRRQPIHSPLRQSPSGTASTRPSGQPIRRQHHASAHQRPRITHQRSN